MKAVMLHNYGGNEQISIENTAEPGLQRGEVLIRVHAASVNPVDWKVRNGMARIFTGSRFPKVLGVECSGEIVDVGSGAAKFTKGDAVIGYAGARHLGAYAEYVALPESTVFFKPHNLSFEEASTLPIAGLTALQSLRDHGKIAAGKQVLINGAAGGVGHFAVQIAKVFGAHVTAVCSSRNIDFAKGLGADAVIDHTKEDFTQGSMRYDLIFDAVSMRSFKECGKVLVPHGVYVNTLPNRTIIDQIITAFLPGRKARSMWVRPKEADMEWMKEKIEAGRIRVVLDRVVPLEQVKEAFAYSESGRVRGKVVLNVIPAA
ncbi:MAG: zinc-binding alcohol dehydrogenase [Nitrospirae bacterium GWC2_57_13]|nr:MAG: zinc-binding alcohol dehydrogenase [Nitrospirae bacterium GWC2_57_13]HAS54117.1 zinc-binding alcohol dehydrogenase [Nitrospiraceae bacterium]